MAVIVISIGGRCLHPAQTRVKYYSVVRILKKENESDRERKRRKMMIRLRRTGILVLLCMVFAIVGLVSSVRANEKKADDPRQVQSPVSAGPSIDLRMKTIGVIGGVSWVSSLEYYRLMNEMVRDEFGPLYSAKILMYSIEFGEFSKQERLADKGDWRPLRKTMIDAAQRLKRGGADFVVIASNTMNSTGDLIQARSRFQFLTSLMQPAKKSRQVE